MTEQQLYGLLDLYRRYQRTVTQERTLESKFEVHKTNTGFCVQIGHKTGVGETMELAIRELEMGLDSAIARHINQLTQLARQDACDPMVVKFRFRFGLSPADDLVGGVVGAGGFVVSLERLREEARRAFREESLQIFEPKPGCVLVYPTDVPQIVPVTAIAGYA